MGAQTHIMIRCEPRVGRRFGIHRTLPDGAGTWTEGWEWHQPEAVTLPMDECDGVSDQTLAPYRTRYAIHTDAMGVQTEYLGAEVDDARTRTAPSLYLPGYLSAQWGDSVDRLAARGHHDVIACLMGDRGCIRVSSDTLASVVAEGLAPSAGATP